MRTPRPRSTGCCRIGFPTWPSYRSATARRSPPSIAAASSSRATANGTVCAKRPSPNRQKEEAAPSRRKDAARRDGGGRLLQAGQRCVDRELGDEGRAAPVGRRATRIDRRAEHARGRMVAGEGVAVTLVQVGVVIAEVEREDLVGQAEA